MTTPQRVRIVGTGLLGASIGLALRTRGVEVSLADISPVSMALAADLGAGRMAQDDDAAPDVVVAAAPPDVVAQVVVAELARWPQAVVTDVASVKARVLADVEAHAGADAARYVGSHPMAGRERSGAVAARSDLFEGRTWVVCGEPEDAPAVAVADLARLCGARVVHMNPAEHDVAVAAVSHVPQVAASAVAAQLRELSEDAIALSGQGVRDVTRIAASDPLLWTQILSGNAEAVVPVLDGVLDELTQVRDALTSIVSPARAQSAVLPQEASSNGPRAVLARAIADGQDGRARIPGKHGSPRTAYATVAVVIPDEPGSLGRVFTLVGASGVSVEDLRIEHDNGVAAGLLEIDVLPVRAATLHEMLTAEGWRAHVLENP